LTTEMEKRKKTRWRSKEHNRWIEAKNRRDRAVQQRKEEMEKKTFPMLYAMLVAQFAITPKSFRSSETYLRLVWRLWTNSRGPNSYSSVQTPVQQLTLSSCQLSAAGRQELGRLRCSQGRRRRPLRAALHITIDYMQ
jgi:hypothetical protein